MRRISENQTTCFEHSPCGMLVMDKEGFILQMNPALAAMLGVPAERFKGENTATLKPAVYRSLFSGKGAIHLAAPGIDKEKWFHCDEVAGADGIIRFYQDITELVKLKQEVGALRQQVEDLTITDKLTGLANPRAFNRALNSQVTRSRRYNNPLCLVIMELIDKDNPAASLDDEVILATSRHLRDRLRWADTIARWDHNHFVIILPETNAEHGSDLIAKISSGFPDLGISSLRQSRKLKLRYGLAQWMKGNDSKMLMDRAAQNLNAQAEEQLQTAVT